MIGAQHTAQSEQPASRGTPEQTSGCAQLCSIRLELRQALSVLTGLRPARFHRSRARRKGSNWHTAHHPLNELIQRSRDLPCGPRFASASRMSPSHIAVLFTLVGSLTIAVGCGGAVATVDVPNEQQEQVPVAEPASPPPRPNVGQPRREAPSASSSASTSGYCTTTAVAYSPMFGGVEGGDAICERELPGSHFYRRSRDELRRFQPALAKWPRGYGEIELGDCWNCRGWTSGSGAYDPSQTVAGCIDGYATGAALVPSPADPALGGRSGWRICDAGDWPLTCCFP